MREEIMAKICHITSAHRITDARIFLKQCKTLAREGHDVVLVGPHDKDERIEGVQIRAIVRQNNRFMRMTEAVRESLMKAIKENAVLYHFHDSELIFAGLMLRAIGKKVVYDVHEDYPGAILSRSWIHPLFRRIISLTFDLFEKSAAKFFSSIVAATPAIAAKFSKRKVVILRNYPILDEFKLDAPIPYAARPNMLGYIGGMSLARGTKEMIQAIGLLQERLGARLLVAGSFSPPELKEDLEKLPGWGRVQFLGWLSRRDTIDVLGQIRAGVLLLHPIPNHVEAMPVKLFEYMAVGVPVIASNFPLFQEIVGGAGCGLLVNPLDPEAIAKAMAWLLDNKSEAELMGKRGQEMVRKQYNWDTESIKLTTLYAELLR